jgi:hypothetical protein
VGVSGADSSIALSISVGGCWEKRTFGVGVVGVLSPTCLERSGALSEEWTMSLEEEDEDEASAMSSGLVLAAGRRFLKDDDDNDVD